MGDQGRLGLDPDAGRVPKSPVAAPGGPRQAFKRPEPEDFLWIASALLLATNLLVLLAVFVNFIAGLGPLTPRNLVSLALVLDLVGAALLGWVVWDAGGRVEGPSRWIRRTSAVLLFTWVALAVVWRFALPAAPGANVQDLFEFFLTGPATSPEDVRHNLPAMYQLLGLWVAAAALFVAAHVLLGIARWTAPPYDWVGRLPVVPWVVGAVVSLAATASIVLSFLYVLAGRLLADDFNAWLIAKVIVAPNVFLSGYASSVDLGRKIRSGRDGIRRRA